MSNTKQIRVMEPLYGGASATSDPHLMLPFVLRGELVDVALNGQVTHIAEAAAERVTPKCPHFGTCGGCQYQMVGAMEQLNIKRSILHAELEAAGVTAPIDIAAHGGESYGYRNRIRLRVERVSGELRLGYNVRATTEFLPITTCPIAAPVLSSIAEAVLAAASKDRDAEFWLAAASEMEIFCNDDGSRVQVTLLCAPRTKAKQGSLSRCFNAMQRIASQIVGLAAIASDPRTGPTGRTLDAVGAAGLSYRVGDENYWISRGGFFQVNRFLLGKLVELVCEVDEKAHTGGLAWDLYAGVGLFSHILARSFTQVVAVESNWTATADNHAALAKLGPAHQAIASTTLDFLRTAILQRERPELVVLDPPRAGAGVEACELLLRLMSTKMVYVSCDPTTLARDLEVLQRGYSIAAMHLVDLFPQTFHMETVVVLERKK